MSSGVGTPDMIKSAFQKQHWPQLGNGWGPAVRQDRKQSRKKKYQSDAREDACEDAR